MVEQKVGTDVAQAEWAAQIEVVRPLVERLAFERNHWMWEEREGVRALIGYVFRQDYPHDPKIKPQEAIAWSAVEGQLLTLFTGALPDMVPENVKLVRRTNGQTFQRSSPLSRLLPAEILLFVEMFGLWHGRGKNPQELSQIYGVSVSTIRARLLAGRDVLRWSKGLRELVLDLPRKK